MSRDTRQVDCALASFAHDDPVFSLMCKQPFEYSYGNWIEFCDSAVEHYLKIVKGPLVRSRIESSKFWSVSLSSSQSISFSETN